MQRLREQQAWLASLVLEPGLLAGERASLEQVTPLEARAARERLAVYVDGYPARLLEALDEAYPALHHAIGDGAFHALVHRYATCVPAGIYSLTDTGSELPAFLRGDALSAKLPILPDLALLEWRVLRAFHAEQRAPLDPALLSGWQLEDWEGARMVFQPAVSIVRSAWPVYDLWQHRETPISEIDLDVTDRPQNVLVHRSEWSVECELVDDARALVLEALLDGETLGIAIERLTDAHDDVADVSEWFASWTARGLLVDCRRSGV